VERYAVKHRVIRHEGAL